jgi:hypothetical protein
MRSKLELLSHGTATTSIVVATDGRVEERYKMTLTNGMLKAALSAYGYSRRWMAVARTTSLLNV